MVRAAGMDLEHAALHQRDQPVEIVDGDDLVAFLRDLVQVLGADAGGGVLLEKALPGGAFRAAHQRDRRGRRHAARIQFQIVVIDIRRDRAW